MSVCISLFSGMTYHDVSDTQSKQSTYGVFFIQFQNQITINPGAMFLIIQLYMLMWQMALAFIFQTPLLMPQLHQGIEHQADINIQLPLRAGYNLT